MNLQQRSRRRPQQAARRAYRDPFGCADAPDPQMLQVQKLHSLGVLAGGIAHDFNNLLVGILGNASIALGELPGPSAVRDRLEDIRCAAQRAAELSTQMLDYSGKGRSRREPLALSDVVGELTKLLRAAIPKNSEIAVRAESGLPAFVGDAAQIRQVLMNLITNAADAIGDRVGRIDVRTGRVLATERYLSDACIGRDVTPGEYVFAEVTDSGCGMDAATRARIFDPFFTTKCTGRGLGLAAVLGIVRSHGGAIKLASSVGVGTSFRVLLPAVSAEVAAEAAPRELLEPAHGRVLVIDDEEAVRVVSELSLSRVGFDVITADGGEAALQVVRDEGARVDAVLLDVTMPRMTGVDACDRIRQLEPGLPVVLMSGYQAPEALSRFAEGTVTGFIQKPFTPAALVQVMRDAVAQRRHATPEPC